MDCPHCGKAFHPLWFPRFHLNDPKILFGKSVFHGRTDHGKDKWYAAMVVCPACQGAIVHLYRDELVSPEHDEYEQIEIRAYPLDGGRPPAPIEVPEAIATDYQEACRVLSRSPKASAALARRCLQGILHQQGYNENDLSRQIHALLNESEPARVIPSSLRDTVDAIRNFGNFSAHPITDKTTLQIVDVEPGEAEWCLDILLDMFDHYYVKPSRAAARKDDLNKKLAAARKPPAK